MCEHHPTYLVGLSEQTRNLLEQITILQLARLEMAHYAISSLLAQDAHLHRSPMNRGEFFVGLTKSILFCQ